MSDGITSTREHLSVVKDLDIVFRFARAALVDFSLVVIDTCSEILNGVRRSQSWISTRYSPANRTQTRLEYLEIQRSAVPSRPHCSPPTNLPEVTVIDSPRPLQIKPGADGLCIPTTIRYDPICLAMCRRRSTLGDPLMLPIPTPSALVKDFESSNSSANAAAEDNVLISSEIHASATRNTDLAHRFDSMGSRGASPPIDAREVGARPRPHTAAYLRPNMAGIKWIHRLVRRQGLTMVMYAFLFSFFVSLAEQKSSISRCWLLSSLSAKKFDKEIKEAYKSTRISERKGFEEQAAIGRGVNTFRFLHTQNSALCRYLVHTYLSSISVLILPSNEEKQGRKSKKRKTSCLPKFKYSTNDTGPEKPAKELSSLAMVKASSISGSLTRIKDIAVRRILEWLDSCCRKNSRSIGAIKGARLQVKVAWKALERKTLPYAHLRIAMPYASLARSGVTRAAGLCLFWFLADSHRRLRPVCTKWLLLRRNRRVWGSFVEFRIKLLTIVALAKHILQFDSSSRALLEEFLIRGNEVKFQLWREKTRHRCVQIITDDGADASISPPRLSTTLSGSGVPE
ncbi:hypothetical protein R3P38DRAFT_2805915 [Favolaschia claudopus]|uniref:Uncharacterized protein n=1 Tax=Favolaschia claudopus TaxID=2862362 RepID=A0AAV9ZLS3_9AGAR